jgi:hypothetical protein
VPPWAMPLATSKELLSTSACLNLLDASPADFPQLRDKNENEAANSIAKATISILNIFNDATADWDIEKCLMNPLPVSTACKSYSNPRARLTIFRPRLSSLQETTSPFGFRKKLQLVKLPKKSRRTPGPPWQPLRQEMGIEWLSFAQVML